MFLLASFSRQGWSSTSVPGFFFSHVPVLSSYRPEDAMSRVSSGSTTRGAKAVGFWFFFFFLTITNTRISALSYFPSGNDLERLPSIHLFFPKMALFFFPPTPCVLEFQSRPGSISFLSEKYPLFESMRFPKKLLLPFPRLGFSSALFPSLVEILKRETPIQHNFSKSNITHSALP